ncbi:putative vacuolar amino acid transporter YPQ1 [Smittium culicis]|uniref:Putative vacuolar amino acid transporter YPQ1 n=1 Tax=Smittium culicis TaxID=133412 RepID=A0A1R1XTQ7_9FUNG|nr:putative vacuolar amino acid transporter YPQ1 [Smittium culicis]OMJ21056.1 putative vacuolar amino acid transporter YPQ1 [Smittium culicis]
MMFISPTSPFRHVLSQFFGYLSLLFSAIVTVPQVYENYTNKNGDSVSMTMLWIWIAADLLNFAGSVMQGIIFTAIIQALYFLLTDIIIILQTYYYRIYYKDGKLLQLDSEEAGAQSEHLIAPSVPNDNSSSNITSNTASYGAVQANEPGNPEPIQSPAAPLISERIKTLLFKASVIFAMIVVFYFYCLGIDTTYTNDYELSFWPQLFGYLSALLYAFSRVPQIIQNYKTKSVVGLSIIMFALTLASNIAYIISFFAESTELDQIIPALPWILGSAVSPFLDIIIFYQFYIYR